MAFDIQARKDKEQVETEALKKLIAVCPEFGKQLHDLWYEFEDRGSLEAQIAKAADAICPVFQRLQSDQSYIPFDVSINRLNQIKEPIFIFSKTFEALFLQLKLDLLERELILN